MTDRQDRQTTVHSIGRTVLQTVAQKSDGADQVTTLGLIYLCASYAVNGGTKNSSILVKNTPCISHDNVATCFSCSNIFQDDFITNVRVPDSENFY